MENNFLVYTYIYMYIYTYIHKVVVVIELISYMFIWVILANQTEYFSKKFSDQSGQLDLQLINVDKGYGVACNKRAETYK